ncbi:MAG: pyridoxine 5'-phosphate synthase, partial [Saprospiraceae bacterium]|nr:pyridoxine 5'-phosphate synthase [Saprospiraceae bacterium]
GDVPLLKACVTTEFNIEGNPAPEFLELVLANPPHQCTLVPDATDQLTSDHGWDTIRHAGFLKEVIAALHVKNIRVSVFVDPDARMVEGARAVGADRIELYTGPYAHDFIRNPAAAVRPYTEAARIANEVGIGINAGHDLNLDNLRFFQEHCPGLQEVSIGHALISDALYYGLSNTIKMYLQQLED